MWIIEVIYVWDSKWCEKEEAKKGKYKPLVERLEQVGWEV
jgi:hypothetical protein